MPLWAWVPLLAYLSLLLLAAVWAAVGRVRSAWVRRGRRAHAELVEQMSGAE
jgi:hypothetical protein